VNCDGSLQNGYVCIPEGEYYEVSGLVHSAVVEYVEFCGNGRCGEGENGNSCIFDCQGGVSSRSELKVIVGVLALLVLIIILIGIIKKNGSGKK